MNWKNENKLFQKFKNSIYNGLTFTHPYILTGHCLWYSYHQAGECEGVHSSNRTQSTRQMSTLMFTILIRTKHLLQPCSTTSDFLSTVFQKLYPEKKKQLQLMTVCVPSEADRTSPWQQVNSPVGLTLVTSVVFQLQDHHRQQKLLNYRQQHIHHFLKSAVYTFHTKQGTECCEISSWAVRVMLCHSSGVQHFIHSTKCGLRQTAATEEATICCNCT